MISNLIQSVSDICQMYPTSLDVKEPFKNYLQETTGTLWAEIICGQYIKEQHHADLEQLPRELQT